MASERARFWAEIPQLVRAIARAMGVTFRNLLRRPITVRYPTVKRVYPDRFRGLLALTYDPQTGEENCIGCRLCEYICPPTVIKVEMLKAEKRNFAKSFTLELYACEFCELCVQVCPTDAIIMMKSFDLATADRRELLLDKDRLHALGLQFDPSWATGNRLRDMQAPPKPAKAPAHAPEPASAAQTSPDRRAAERTSAEQSSPARRAPDAASAAQTSPDRRAPEPGEGAPTSNSE